MGEQFNKASLLPQLFQHGDRLTTTGDKWNAEPGQGWPEVGQTFLLKGGVGRAPFWLGQNFRFVEEDSEDPRPPRPLCR